ncbi:MAG: UvrD-helicase domain-containing protein [Candidatus Moranbacteria bacterium]|nr:UvrD-helicase domain-containing protein [Candidatus Moranbacteria bacterium]
MKDFLEKGLNPEQLRAMKATDGPVLILAGAGSGKTKTLTHRLAYLMHEKHIAPHNILAVTFTNKASQEMRERITHLLEAMTGEHATHRQALPHIGTFHNICAKILRQEIEVLGYGKNFNISDDQDQLSLMKKVMKSLDINTDQIQPRSILSAISKAKNELLDEEQFALSASSYYEEQVAKAYREYQKELRCANTLDFDDLIFLTVRLLQDFLPVLEKYQNLFRYIMVDEYQDTNHSQYMLITLLAKRHRNLFVIGDDYQSIYGWRQADIRNILDFEKDYADAKIITLDRNYRSTQIILDAAGSVIARNENQRHKKMWTELVEGEKIVVFSARDEREEAEYVVQEVIRRAEEEHRPMSDFAVLYRTNAQSRMMEEAFLRASLPYRVVGGIKFYQRKEIKDIIAYLRLTKNPLDNLALERIINEPKRNLGKATLEKWSAYAQSQDMNLLESGFCITAEESGLREVKLRSIHAFCELIQGFHKTIETSKSLFHLIGHILKKSGYLKSLDDKTSEGEARQENVRELLSVAKKYDEYDTQEALNAFLEEVMLASDTDSIDQKQPAIHLMTVHSSKGLEFPVIFVIGLEEGIFPHSRSAFSQHELEEERRLMYVALTRAKQKIYLLFADQRTIFGSTQINPPSRFVSEIPEELVNEERLKRSDMMLSAFAEEQEKRKPKLFSKSDAFRPGDSITHPDFGQGLIVTLVNDIATIAFKKKGLKKISIALVPLKKL